MIVAAQRSRFHRSLLFCIFSFSLTGCYQIARGPGNRSIWHTRFPKKPDFKGVVFILENPPAPEFALLLAQQYPQSFVVNMRVEKKPRDPFYLLRDSYTPLARSEGTIKRKTTWFTKGQTVSVRSRALPSVLILHQMFLTACDQLSESFTRGSCVRLTWSKTLYKNAEAPQKHSILTDLNASTGGFSLLNLLNIPDVLTAGALSRPRVIYAVPTGKNQNTIEELTVSFASADGDISIPARKAAYRGIFYGDAFAPLISPFVKASTIIPFSEPAYFDGRARSPGGWADCLEQMFLHPEVLKVASNVMPECLGERETWFKKQFEVKGFRMQPIPDPDPYAHEESNLRAYLLPRNPVLNLYIAERDLFSLKFGRVEWPGVCVFTDASDPQGPEYLWAGFDSQGNHFFQVLHEYDQPI